MQLLDLVLVLDLLLVGPLAQDLVLDFGKGQLLLDLVLLRQLNGDPVLVLLDLLFQLRVLNDELGQFLPQFLIGPFYLDLLLQVGCFLFVELLYGRTQLPNLLPLLQLLRPVPLPLMLEPAEPLPLRLLQRARRPRGIAPRVHASER